MRALVTAALVAALPLAAAPAAAQTYEFLFEFGSLGDSLGRFNVPTGVTFDPDGNIVVAESNNNRIQICDPAQSPVSCVAFGSLGSDPGQFSLPYGVAVDPDGDFVVADTNRHRIQICDRSGACTVFVSSLPGTFAFPRGVAVDPDGNIVVADTFNHRIQICDPTQSPVSCVAFGSEGSGLGQFNHPFGVAVDPDGNIVVADTNNHRIQVCDPTQSPVSCVAFGGFGGAPGQFNLPRGVAVDPDGNIVVADSSNHRIQVFGLVAVACEGFAPPFDAPIGLGRREQRVIPLRMEIFDGDFPLGPIDIAPPTVSVTYSTGIPGGELEQLVDSPGRASSGNSFVWDEASQRWAFNLATKPYTAAGAYTVTVVAGDEDYVLDPTCSNTFVRQ